MWKNYGMTFIEYVHLNKFKIKNLHMIIKGKDNLTSIIKKKNLSFLYQVTLQTLS